jgi:hypothetical protein
MSCVYCTTIVHFEGKNNRHFCYKNWRHVGEQVEGNRLSIRRSPCNKRSTCLSVLMCCKKTYWVTLKIRLYSTYSSFLVINGCNQGKTLCSPCTYKRNVEARSRNHCCRGKAICVTHTGCVFVALIIQHEMRMRRVILSHVSCLTLPYFSTLSPEENDFRRKKSFGT